MIILPRANTRLATNVAINVVRKRKSKRKIEKKKRTISIFNYEIMSIVPVLCRFMYLFILPLPLLYTLGEIVTYTKEKKKVELFRFALVQSCAAYFSFAPFHTPFKTKMQGP